jgi:hypothetical protein
VRYWACHCDCGNEVEVSSGGLNNGHTRSCGCLKRGISPRRIDLAGRVFGRLTAVRMAKSRQQSGTTVGYWVCLCECGTETVVPTNNLTSGNSTSCGCYLGSPEHRAVVSASLTRHGHNMSNSTTYRSWQGMRRRCASRPGYADRDIFCVPRWDSFENFFADMGERPIGCTLDRVDNDGPYSPENCRWATRTAQSNNRRNTCYLTYRDRTQPLADWAREVGVRPNVLYNRVYTLGWPLEWALAP